MIIQYKTAKTSVDNCPRKSFIKLHCPTCRLSLLFFLFFISVLLLPLTVSAATGREKKMDQAIGKAIGELMTRQTVRSKDVTLLPKAAHSASSYLKESNFFLTTVITYQRESTQQGFRLDGKFVHQDILMRSIVSHFEATGSIQDDIAEIHKLTLTPIYSSIPRTAFFYIPDNSITLQKLADISFDKALQAAQNTARKLNGKLRPDKSPQNYIIALFVMEQRQEKEKITLTVPKRAAIPGGKAEGVYKNKGGWHALFVPVRLTFDNDQEQFFNVGISSPDKGKQSLFTYSSYSLTKKLQIALNAKGYNTGTPDGVFGSHTRKAIITFQKDHDLIADGQKSLPLLNLVRGSNFNNGIRLAQNRLMSIGYDPGVADGKMGRKTQEALRSFQKNFSLKQNGSLTTETLSMLLIVTDTKIPMPVTLTKADRFELKMWPNLKAVH